jgi:hypothetical protein
MIWHTPLLVNLNGEEKHIFRLLHSQNVLIGIFRILFGSQKVASAERAGSFMNERSRGLFNILTAACQARCSVPFNSRIHSFQQDSGKFAVLTIRDGYGTRGESDRALESPKRNVSGSRKIELINGIPSRPIEDSEIEAKLKTIHAHLLETGEKYFKKVVTNLNLVFFVDDAGNIVLGGSSSMSLAPRPPVTSRSVQSRSTNKPKEVIRPKTPAGSTSLPVSVPLTEIYAAIDEHLDVMPPETSCVFQSPSCQPAHFKFPYVFVIFYLIRDQFPSVRDDALFHIIGTRMNTSEQQCLVCMVCYELLLAASRIWECSTIRIPKNFGLEPKPFQGLSEAELKVKEQYPVGISTAVAEPHSFSLNIMHSPYKGGTIVPKKPENLKYERKRLDNSARGGWVERLSAVPPREYPHKNSDQISSEMQRGEKVVVRLPEYEPGTPFSQRKAKGCYEGMPFDITRLDYRRKKKWHKDPVVYTSRL